MPHLVHLKHNHKADKYVIYFTAYQTLINVINKMTVGITLPVARLSSFCYCLFKTAFSFLSFILHVLIMLCYIVELLFS